MTEKAIEKPKPEPKEKKALEDLPESEKPYYIINPAGAIHGVNKDRARELLRKPGYRMATKEEVKMYMAAKPHKGFGPVAKPWNPEPEDIELD